MVSKTNRKIFKIGGKKYKTFVISLPKDWVRFNQQKEVELFYNGCILIIPKNANKEKRERLIKALE